MVKATRFLKLQIGKHIWIFGSPQIIEQSQDADAITFRVVAPAWHTIEKPTDGPPPAPEPPK